QQGLGKGRVAVPCQLLDQGVIAQVALQNHGARLVLASGAARHLDDQLAHALDGAEVGAEESPSTSIRAARVTWGKWWPLASIWVPRRMQGSPWLTSFTRLSMASLRRVVS